MVTFSSEPILVKLEGGRYVGPLLPDTLVDLVSGRRDSGGCRCGGIIGDSGVSGGSGCGGNGCDVIGIGGTGSSGGSRSSGGSINGGRGRAASRVSAGEGDGGYRGAARVQVRYEAHVPSLSLQDG